MHMLCITGELSHHHAKARKKLAIYVQAPAHSSFSDIHNHSEEDCQADHWEKPFENLLILNQLLFASVIIIRCQLPCVLVWKLWFGLFHFHHSMYFDSVLACSVTE
jgi:hypothetical protein